MATRILFVCVTMVDRCRSRHVHRKAYTWKITLMFVRFKGSGTRFKELR